MRSVMIPMFLALAACAAQPSDPLPSPSAPAANDSALAERAEAVGLDLATADLADLQAAGYEIRTKNGETLYCRKDNETGSRVRKNQYCLTRQQLQEIEANTKAAMRDITQGASPKSN